jgi:mono/diheme cytochrome c family protein
MMGRRKVAQSLVLLLLAWGCSRNKEASVAKPTAGVEPQPPAAVAVEKPLSYELRLGRAVFQHYCMTCHGETGAGDGFNAFNVDPHPRDLTDPAFQKKKSNADLTEAIRRGGTGVGLSPLMPPWGRTLTAAQVDQVILYIRTLKKAGA